MSQSPGAGAQDPPVIDDPGGIGEVDPFTPFVTIDWTMPDRYDDSPSLVVDEDPYDDVDPAEPWNNPEYREYLRPGSWSVDLFATISNGSNFGTPQTWSWELDGPGLAAPLTSTDSAPTLQVPELGTYEATVTVTDDGGATLSSTREVEVDDLLVAVLGDSLNSGEGNPDVPGNLSDGWLGEIAAIVADPSYPGPIPRDSDLPDLSEAFPENEISKPRRSVTYVNVACTGAWSTNLVDLPHPGLPSRARCRRRRRSSRSHQPFGSVRRPSHRRSGTRRPRRPPR